MHISSNIHYNFNSKDSLFYSIDESGYLLPPLRDISCVKGLNRMVLTDLSDRLQTLLGDSFVSFYFRGSQLFSERVSDFDTIVVLKEIGNYNSKSISTELNGFFSNKYFHINYFDTLVLDKESIKNNRNYQFLIKVLSVHVFGDLLHREYVGFKPDRDVVFLLDKLKEKLEHVIREIYHLSEMDKYKASNYLIKFLIRSAFELVVIKEGRYTRDLNTCQFLFSRHFPQFEDVSLKLLGYYNKRKFSITDFTELANKFGKILLYEYQRTFTS